MKNIHCRRADFSLPNPPTQYPPDLGLEPFHMSLGLEFDIENKTVSGMNTISIRANVDAQEDLELNAVDFDELEVKDDDISWEYDGDLLSLTLDTPLNKGETRDITIEYKVVEPVAGLYFSYPDQDYPNRPVYVVSDHETERARHWIPCVDHPSIRTTFEWKLTSSADHTILAIGEEGESLTEDDRKTVYWNHDYPCPVYIAAIAIGKFTSYEDRSVDTGNGPIPIAYFTSEDYEPENLKLAFDRTPAMIEWFSEKFDMAIPWAKYYQFSAYRIFGAMENQSLVSWSDYAMLNEETAKEYSMNVDSTNIHELAHTFFGDMVVIRDWGHAWLKESWATYITALYFEEKLDQDEFVYDMYTNARRYFSEADNRYIRPIVTRTFHSSWEMFDSHLYPGGAWRLHMLRKLLGDELFFDAVRAYLKRHAGETVETVDFIRVLEEFSGRSLAKFFDQWILEARGYPTLDLNFSYNKEKKKGTFTIKQDHVKEDDDKKSTNPFTFHLDLSWTKGDQITTRTVKISDRKHQFSFDMENKPDYVGLDPEHKILFKLKLGLKDKMIRMMLQSSDMITRITAAEKLVKTGKRKNINHVGKHLLNEEFWGVRKELVEFLGSSNSRFAIPYLVNILEQEEDYKLLYHLPTACAKFKDDKIEDALHNFLDRDLPPIAKARTLQALGTFRTDRSEETIKSYLDYDGFRDIVRSAAYSALGKSRNKENLDLLLDKAKYGNEKEKARSSIIGSIGQLGQWLEPLDKTRAREGLEQILRDDFDHIRITAARGLVKLKDTKAIPKLNMLKGAHPKQDEVYLEKLINSLRKSEKSENKYKDLNSKIEELSEKIQKIDENLQKLEFKFEEST